MHIGLTQRQLARLVGCAPSRICALENGNRLPTIQECVVFRILFNRAFEEMWPGCAAEVEEAAYSRIKRLMDRLEHLKLGKDRRSIRASFVQRKLETIIDDLPKE